MKLRDSVFYREYNGKTFVVDTVRHRTYRFDAPVAHLFDLFTEDITIEAAARKLSKRYPNADYHLIAEDIGKMIRFLRKNNMLSDVDATKEANQTSVNPNTQFFQKYTIQEKLLYSALFELTYRCPEHCIHCYLEPSSASSVYESFRNTELTTEEIMNILDQLADMNVMCVTFTGGEPFLRPDIFEILEYARKKKFVIDIFSNGILLSDNDIAHLKKLQINCFHSSVYSHIPQKHDNITGVNGSFEKTIKTLRKLSENGIYVNIKSVLMEQNKTDFIPVAEFSKSIGATIQLISNVSPSKTGNCGLSCLNVRDDEVLKRAFQYWNRLTGVEPQKDAPDDDTPICEAGRNSISINPYGIVTPCNAFEYEIGDLRKNTVYDIWHNSEKLKWWQQTTLKDLDECQDCQYIKYCGFCPGNALKVTGRMFGRVEEACRQARIRYELHHQK